MCVALQTFNWVYIYTIYTTHSATSRRYKAPIRKHCLPSCWRFSFQCYEQKRQKSKLQQQLLKQADFYKCRSRSKASRTTRMVLFNKPWDTICSVPLCLNVWPDLCFGWKHEQFGTVSSKMQRIRPPDSSQFTHTLEHTRDSTSLAASL